MTEQQLEGMKAAGGCLAGCAGTLAMFFALGLFFKLAYAAMAFGWGLIP